MFSADEEIKDLLAEACADTSVAAKLFFPERFYLPYSPIHRKIFAAIDDPELNQIAIAAPRGFGKTSMCMAKQAKSILFQEKRFIVTVSAAAKGGALLQSENLKNKLLESKTIRTLFGDLKSAKWSQDMWMVDWYDSNFKTVVLPRGAGQLIRGILSGDDRPDLIIVDDLEDDKEVLSEEQRAKTRGWFFSSLCNTINRARHDWKIIYIDTIKHEDCLMQRLLERSDWHPLRFQLANDKLETNWPEYMSTEEIRQLYADFRDNGEADAFFREYMNLPISTEEAGFQKGFFHYYSETKEKLNNSLDIINFVIMDPAKTTNPKSAKTAILGGAVNVLSHKIFLRELVNERLHPDEAIDEAFNMCQRLGAEVFAVEVTSLNEFITYPIENEIVRRRMGLTFVELNPRDKKENRAKALIPLYRLGQIYHNDSGCMVPLEMQELSFPRPKRWDALDCAAYIVELLAKGHIYFQDEAVDSYEAVREELSELEHMYEGEMDGPPDSYDWAPDVTVGGMSA